MIEWKIVLAALGINMSSLIGLIWWMSSWYTQTKSNSEDIDELKQTVSKIETTITDLDRSIMSSDNNHKLLRQEMKYSMEALVKAQTSILDVIREKNEDDRQYRKEQETLRTSTMTTFVEISENMKSQATLVSEALRSANLSKS